MAGEVHHHVGGGDGEKGRDHGGAVDLGIGLLHAMAQVLAEDYGLGEGLEIFLFDRSTVGRRGGVGDAQGPPLDLYLGQERSRGRGRHVGISRARAGGGVEQRRGIPHCERHRVLGGAAGQPLSDIRRHGVAPAGGLEPDHAAAGRGRANGAEAVRGMGHGQHARTH